MNERPELKTILEEEDEENRVDSASECEDSSTSASDECSTSKESAAPKESEDSVTLERQLCRLFSRLSLNDNESTGDNYLL